MKVRNHIQSMYDKLLTVCFALVHSFFHFLVVLHRDFSESLSICTTHPLHNDFLEPRPELSQLVSFLGFNAIQQLGITDQLQKTFDQYLLLL